MAQDIKVSVIIPVYSVAQYLPECVESVLKQSYPHTELILVDDGSPDEAPAICDRYAASFPNVQVIHKANGGLSDARNKGIARATGDYVAFLDGDDFWDDADALARLVDRLNATGADVLNFSYKKFFEDTEEKIPYFYGIPDMPLDLKTKNEQLDYLAKNRLYIASACNKLVRRTLLTEQLLFQPGVYSEDVEWCARLMRAAGSMDFVCANFYCYRQRRDSISHTINDKKCRDLCEHIIRCITLAGDAAGMEQTALAHYAAYQYGTFFVVQAQAENPQHVCIDKLSGHHRILENHLGNRKLLLLGIGCKVLGYKQVCKWIRFLYRMKNRT